jgi:hypothetical protein
MVKRNGSLTDTINFESFPAAALTLFVVATGDGWTDIRDSCSRSRSLDFDCVENPTFSDYLEAGETVGCGPGIPGFFFFNSYYLIMNLILLKLFIAVICQCYEDVKDHDERWFKEDVIDAFNQIWAEFDHDATGFISIADIEPLINKLHDNKLINKGFQNWKKNEAYQQQLFIGSLGLQVYCRYVNKKIKIWDEYWVKEPLKMGLEKTVKKYQVREEEVFEDE